MDKVGHLTSLPDLSEVNWDVAISTGRRIASRLDCPGRGRSMALVCSPIFTCTSMGVYKELFQFPQRLFVISPRP
jgi:hypothetical protein